MALVRGDHALGAFYRRLAARTDKPTAMTATARKLALLVYRMLTYKHALPSHIRGRVRHAPAHTHPPRPPQTRDITRL